MAEKRKIPLIRILLNDYLAMLSVLFALVLWGMYFVLLAGWDIPDIRQSGKTVSSEDSSILFWMAVAVSVPGLFAALWRIRFIRGVFTRGVVVKGKITRVRRIRSRGFQTSARVKFRYAFSGREFVRSNWLLSWDLNKEEGDSIEVILLAEKPEKALIREVYEGSHS